MPGPESPTSNQAQGDWHQGTQHFPSHYSPRSQAANHPGNRVTSNPDLTGTVRNPDPNADVDQLPSLSSLTTTLHDDASTTVHPPPSLLSPAFTPPTTPGSVTPSQHSTSDPTPRGVPVDSSIPGGGCGTKRPRLLDSLPNIQCVVRARIPTVTGTEMFLHLYTNDLDNKEHLAIVFGPHIRSQSLDAPQPGETEMDRMIRGAYTGRLYPGRTTSRMPAHSGEDDSSIVSGSTNAPAEESQAPTGPPLVRIHSECYTGETAWSARCDCGEQLDEAARLMSMDPRGGIIVYLRQEGRGIGLGEKLKAYNLQDLGSDTVEANLLLRHPADARSYGLATAMLRDLGQEEVRLLTNNPDKIRAVEGPNREVRVTERVAMVPLSWKGKGGFRSREVEGYLKTKIEKMGHMLDAAIMPRT
ncbi:hypothetical protein ACRALDRAFT_1040434 [Sodiomyces alcalophilus JCM 7366]|uniref:uncharacterized protein n=1 Tax=Sodiomyces alcalophilus JCM 7366 TaxID=591952 RepID=UPI0039B381AB